MKTQVEFRSDAFPPYPEEEELVNPGCFGKRLAEYLATALCQKGFEAGGPIPEDWGWIVAIKNEQFPMWIGCGNFDNSTNEFLCVIEPQKSFVWRWFKRIDTRQRVEPLQLALAEILAADSRISQVQWKTADNTVLPTKTTAEKPD